MILEDEITKEEILESIAKLASCRGWSVSELYSRVDAGQFRGHILESKIHMFRFLLGE